MRLNGSSRYERLGFMRARSSPEVEADVCARVERGESFTAIAKLHRIDRRTVPEIWKRVRKTPTPARRAK